MEEILKQVQALKRWVEGRRGRLYADDATRREFRRMVRDLAKLIAAAANNHKGSG